MGGLEWSTLTYHVYKNPHAMISRSKMLLSLALCLCSLGCVSTAVKVSGRFVNPDTHGFVEFDRDGEFYYSFANPAPPLASDGLPRDMGTYIFQSPDDLTPYLSVRSAHAGRFTLRFSEEKDKVFLKWPGLFPREVEFVRQ